MGAKTTFDPIPGIYGALDGIFDEINDVARCSFAFVDSGFGCKISDLMRRPGS